MRVYARKTIGWIGYGTWYIFCLTNDGWVFDKGSKKPPENIIKMVQDWPTLENKIALRIALEKGRIDDTAIADIATLTSL